MEHQTHGFLEFPRTPSKKTELMETFKLLKKEKEEKRDF